MEDIIAVDADNMAGNTPPLPSQPETPLPTQPEIDLSCLSDPESPSKKLKTSKAECWNHFSAFLDKNKVRNARCKYCGKTYLADSKIHGTSNLNSHIKLNCPKYPYRVPPAGQSQLVFKPNAVDGSTSLLLYNFSPEKARKALAEMVILDELPFKVVDGMGFKRFCLALQPEFKIPSRFTVARDVIKLYIQEKIILKKMLKGRRLNLTTDTWTSLQNMNYMCLTVHFVDDNWVLRKRIIGFGTVEDHKGETVGRKIEIILSEWSIDSILTITVDNASSNNVAMKYMVKGGKNKKETICNHDFLHVRCCAHILNLIVKEGLIELEGSTKRIRDIVRYIRSSPSRFSSFKRCVVVCNITSKSLLCLDVSTRWNSTYMMLDSAEAFEKAFECMFLEDKKYCDYTLENGKAPPIELDWSKSRCFVQFLKLFYDATRRFSGLLFVTSNLYFDEIVILFSKITELCASDDELLSSMADRMKAKFDKYWGFDAGLNLLLYVSVVLDSRKKLQYLEYWFNVMYGDTKASILIKKVEETVVRLFDSYISVSDAINISVIPDVPTTSTAANLNDLRKDMAAKFQSYMFGKQSVAKTELQKYLTEDIDSNTGDFDILKWWKVNSERLPILSKMASNVMSIPVSTVASEAAFSTGGRVLDPFRTSLAPYTVQALVCTQNWLRDASPISLRSSMEEVEEMEGQFGSYDLNLEQEGITPAPS